MDKSRYLQSFRAGTAAIAAAAGRGALTPLPSCPGWTMTTLLGHLGAVYTSVAKNVRHGQGRDIVNELADLELEPEYVAWFEGRRKDHDAPSDVVRWFEQAAMRLANVFDQVDPAEPSWTWFPPDQTAGFWLRRMAHETAIHAWDAQLAYGDPDALDPDLSADGVDEALFVYQAHVCRPSSTVEGTGESFHFHRTDGPGEWLVRFEGSGMTVTREHARADVALRGTAPTLFLYLWHRISASRLQILGDTALVTRYFDLVPPD